MWTSLIELSSITLQVEGIRLSCGEGGYGSDGFVAASNIDNNHLRWLAFFQRSNPFVAIKLSGGNAIVYSTNKQLWTFPIFKPEHVIVSGKKWDKIS
jgi:NAD(P)H-hydrate repair Nnr-like enzyme with NAD(P)H-hydrate epimerase domain